MDVEGVDWGYIAGLLEGEGSLGISKGRPPRSISPNYGPRIQIIMADREPVEYAAKVFGTEAHQTKDRPGKKTQYRTTCPRKAMVSVLEECLPRFKSDRKKTEARLLISLCRHISETGLAGPKLLSLSQLKYRHWLYERCQAVKL